MGTRADFYVGRGPNAKWIGSIAYDGYPEGITLLLEEKEEWGLGSDSLRNKRSDWPKGQHLFDSRSEEEFRSRVERFLQFREDVTRPEDGWPWLWDNSNATDFAYAFDNSQVYITQGYGWWPAKRSLPGILNRIQRWLLTPKETKKNKMPDSEWPNMSANRKIAFGKRSGLLLISRCPICNEENNIIEKDQYRCAKCGAQLRDPEELY